MKALRTAAFVVGAAALVATGAGAALGAGLIGGVAAGAAAGSAATFAGLTAATLTTIGTAASAAAGVLTLVAGAAAPKGTVGGNATKFKIDKEAGIPVIFGRTYSGGNVVHRQYYDNPTSKMKNQLESWVTVHSLGPVRSVGPLLIDKTTPVAFDADGAASSSFRGNMWLRTQLGACPEASAMQGPFGFFPGWTATSRLSGLAADLWSLDFDSKGKVFPNGVPERGRIVEGMFAYDARLDSTYPGGAGPCRLGNEATYVWTENPSCHAVTWAYGRYQNGLLMAGGGLAATGIDLQPFVEWSNVCDANGWKVGGQVYTTADDAWDVLKMICQAGAAEPMPVGALLSVTFSAPRVSIGTVTKDDLAGDVDVPGGVSRRQRRNTIIPKIRLESHGWEEVPLDPIIIQQYVTVDGGRRPREVSYPLVQDADQAGALAAYEILNIREIEGIELPCKIYALGYRPGDQLKIDIPEALLESRDVVIRSRGIAAASLVVTLSCRTETAGKHAFALGQTGTPPPTPVLGKPSIDTAAPDVGDWSLAGASLAGSGGAIPAIVVTGSAASLAADAIVFDYRAFLSGADSSAGWIGAGIEPPETTRKEISSVVPEALYEVSVRYRTRGVLGDRLILGPVAAGRMVASGVEQLLIANSYPIGISIISSDAGGSASVTISDHQRVYGDRTVTVKGGTITALQNSTDYYLYYDDADRVGGTVILAGSVNMPDGFYSAAHPARHSVGTITTPASGGGSTGGGGSTPPGGGGGRNPNTQIP